MGLSAPGAVAAASPEEATEEHVVFVFATLESHLSGTLGPEPAFRDAHTALFVTWKVTATGRHATPRLRGCIGILEPRRLHTALRDYALTAALHDKRFQPIGLAEVPGLECTVSLLSCFEEAGGWDDWQVGRHGLIIEFSDPQTRVRRSGTYLPEVAHEQGWSKDAAIDSLIHKAGYDGPVDAALRSALRVTRYQSTACTLTYAEYTAAVGAQLQPQLVAA
ncbi:hypothetical protein FOA52_012406 [Chlamydomonas sp. UWO 241]|nr:hypothetical protein FOA52_012406 [Chlamydomonas sp. UWO 241]